ncbi:MAG: mechanosensitive ion channel domain-containing protein [Planctomycetota bacterium]
MRIPFLLILGLVAACALGSLRAQGEQPTIRIGGQDKNQITISSAGIRKVKDLLGPLKLALPKIDDEVQKAAAQADIALLEEKLAALETAEELLKKVGGLGKLRTAVAATVKANKEKAKQARVKIEEVSVGTEPISEAQLNSRKALEEVASQAVKNLQQGLKDYDAQAAAIDQELGTVAKRIEELQAQKKPLESKKDGASILKFEIVEIKIGIESFKRVYHEKLKEVVALEKARDDSALQLGIVERDLASVTFNTTQKAREIQVERDREKTRIAAALKKKEAADTSNSAERRARDVLVALESDIVVLKDEIEGVQDEAESLLVVVRGAKLGAEESFGRMKVRFPEGKKLDQLRRSDLSEQVAIARLGAEAVDDWLTEVEEFEAEASRDTLSARDRAAALTVAIKELESESAIAVGSALRPAPLAVDGDFVTQWALAVELREEAQADLRGKTEAIAEFEGTWREEVLKINKAIEELTTVIEDTNRDTQGALNAARETSETLSRRRSYLADIEFWLKGDPFLSMSTVRGFGADFSSVGDAVRRAVEGLRIQFRQRAWGFADLAAICLLLYGLYSLRSKSGAYEVDGAHRKAWQASGGLASASLAAMLFFRSWMPENPLGYPLVVVPAIVAVWRGLAAIAQKPIERVSEARHDRTQKQAVVDLDAAGNKEDETPRVPLWLGRFFIVFLISMPLAGIVDRLELHSIAFVASFVVTVWAGYWILRSIVKDDGLDRFFPDRHGVKALALAVAWGFVCAMAVAIVMFLLGYGFAGLFLALRAPAAVCVVLLAVTANAFARQFLDRHLGHLASSGDRDGEGGHSHNPFAPVRRDAVFRRLLGFLTSLGAIAATFGGLMLVLEIDLVRLKDYSDYVVMAGRDGSSDIRLGDLVRAGFIFFVIYSFARYIRDFMLSSSGKGAVRQGLRYALSTLLFYSMVIIGVFLAFRSVALNIGQLGWVLAPAGVALGFGMTQIISNFVSGIILFLERPIEVGDIISVGDIEGDVQRISIRATSVRTRDGISIIIPNRKLIEEDVINWSHGDRKTRLQINISIAYGSDVALVKKILVEVADNDRRILKRPRPETSFMGFGASELEFVLLFWLASPDLSLRRRVRSDVNAAVDAAFRRNKVEIPFPQRDIHIRSTVEREPAMGPGESLAAAQDKSSDISTEKPKATSEKKPQLPKTPSEKKKDSAKSKRGEKSR